MPKAGSEMEPLDVQEDPGVSFGSLFSPLASQVEYTRAMFYGREGTGKTTSALTASQGGRVLVINAEGGLRRAALEKHGVNVENVSYYRPANGERFERKELDAVANELRAALRAEPGFVHAVVIDSLTELYRHFLDNAVYERARTSQTVVNTDFVELRDYGTANTQLSRLIRKFRDLPCHLVITALERDKEDEPQVMPAMSPGLAVDVLGFVDYVLRFGSATGDFRARSRGLERVRAKDRDDVLPDVLVEPSFVRLQAYIDGELDRETDPMQDVLVAEAEAKAQADAEKAARKAAVRAKNK